MSLRPKKVLKLRIELLMVLILLVIHGKSLLTPNRNPTYNRHYLVDILVLTIG